MTQADEQILLVFEKIESNYRRRPARALRRTKYSKADQNQLIKMVR